MNHGSAPSAHRPAGGAPHPTPGDPRGPQAGGARDTAAAATANPPRAGAPFQRVVEAYGVLVLRLCTALAGPVDADDAWSETFLSALRSYGDLAPGRDLEPWLVTIAHRKCIDLARARRRGPVPVEKLPSARSRIGIPGSGDEHAPLWRALAELPTVQRHAVVYHHLAGMPYRQVARLLGNSPAAARRAGADGIHALRRTLAPPARGEPAGPGTPPSGPSARPDDPAHPRTASPATEGAAR